MKSLEKNNDNHKYAEKVLWSTGIYKLPVWLNECVDV